MQRASGSRALTWLLCSKSALEKVAINEADVKLVMAEFEFSQAEAELALRKNDGDVAKTLEQLISA